MTFGGINPVKQQQKARTLALIGGSAFLLLILVVIACAFLNADTNASEKTPTIVETQEPEMVSVLVPVATIKSGAKLEPTMFSKEVRPKAGLSPTAIKDFEEIKGFYARSMIPAKVPLVRDFITLVRPTNELTTRIPEGYRAVTIRVDARSAVEGWAKPGARVDVVWTTTANGRQTLKVIVENAKVLSADSSVGQNTVENNKGPGIVAVPTTVTLLVTSKDSQKIQLASSTGSLSLSLRGDEDSGKGEVGGSVTVDDLLGVRRDIDPDEEGIEATVQVRGPDGKLEELILKDGKLRPRKKKVQ